MERSLLFKIFTVQAAGKAFHEASTHLQHNGFIAPFVFSILETLNLQRVAWSGAFRNQGNQELFGVRKEKI
jgi:hypothetical protein